MAKQGKTSLVALAEEVERKAKQRTDVLTDTTAIHMNYDDDGTNALVLNEDRSTAVTVDRITPHAHGQIAARLGIPKPYYDRCLKDAPDILAYQVNGWFEQKPERRMLRMYNENDTHVLRAFMSDRYRRIDNLELMEHAILPTLLETDMKDDIEIVSCEVTESRLYIKVMSKSVTAALRGDDDRVHAGFVVSNSEIGLGAVTVHQYVYRQVCKNGMMGERLFNKYHVGKNVDEANEAFFLDDTLRADDTAIMLKARDMLRASIDTAAFEATVGKMKALDAVVVEHPRKAIEVLGKTFALSEGVQESILARFFKNEDRDGSTMFNLVNAVTNAAEDIEGYDDATALEHTGFKVMTLPRAGLEQIAMAS
jgi:hypothetical protein